MPKTMRESKMLQEVRRWRAEAYESMRREPPATRLQHARDWARRLNLPILNEDDDPRADLRPNNSPVEQQRDRQKLNNE